MVFYTRCLQELPRITVNDVNRIVIDSKPVILSQCSCSCVAGTALCNHIVALLYQTAHYSQLGISAVPPVRSCTETEQSWHKPRTMVSLSEFFKTFKNKLY